MLERLRPLLQTLGEEPPPTSATPPGRADWLWLAALLLCATAELALRADLRWDSPWVAMNWATLAVLPWRRAHPLTTTLFVFGGRAATMVGTVLAGMGQITPVVTLVVLAFPYALLRHGSGRAIRACVPALLALLLVDLVQPEGGLADAVGGFSILSAAMGLGAAMRYRAHARSRDIERIALREREQLARDLHDTVAHHVSAIVIRAQAGAATAATRPEAAIEALRLIETEATKTLGQMRAMVRTLRRGERGELEPTPDLSHLQRLETDRVHVRTRGDLGAVSPTVASATYRIVQESITNARRHARNPSRIDADVEVDARWVRVKVHDDGTSTRTLARAPGYGLLGMSERAELLGGVFAAGPDPQGGWTVVAEFPVQGPPA